MSDTLREDEAMFREVFDNMSSGVIVYETKNRGKDFVIKEINRAVEKIEKIDRKNLIGKNVIEAFPGVKDFGLLDVFRRVWKSGSPERHPISFYEDNRVSGWRNNYVCKLLSGKIVAIYDDVSGHKKTEEALRKSESHYRRMAANVPGLVYQFYMSPDGFISFSFVSESSRQIFKLDPEKIRQDANVFMNIIHPEDREKFHRLCVESAESLLPWKWEGRIIVDGKERWFRGVSRPERPASGEMFWDGLLVDITDRKKIEESQRLTQLGKFSSDMAHEVNGPLQVISARAQLSLERKVADKEVEKNLKIIKGQCDQAVDIIQRLLMFSKPSRGKVRKIRINDSVDFVINLVEHHFLHSNIRIVREFSHSLPAVKADEKQMQEVFMNLLTNAADAMPSGGTITVLTSKENRMIRVDFVDTGKGIPQENMKKIFDPFFTTEEKGTGLGLSVCFGIISAHQGELKYASKVGHGTTATILLPV